jgi:predicted pyridoxine 5'-phosphate oxidase superfamily flavin-nucleotide-binding protein
MLLGTAAIEPPLPNKGPGRRPGWTTMGRFWNLAFTPSVRAVQQRMGSRRAYGRSAGEARGPEPLGPEERRFISERDSFYLASVGEGGWPYVQHRGGPAGFVRVLDESRIGFADYRGNQQYISVGNIEHDDRVALLFMDYPNRTRLKVLAHARAVTEAEDAELVARLAVPGHGARVERGLVLAVEGFDWNCPQHIVPRYTEEEIEKALAPMRDRLEALERENRALRARVGPGPGT